MKWRKIVDSTDLIIFETGQRGKKIKIEARLSDNRWHLYQTLIKGDSSSLIKEYSFRDKKEVMSTIERLICEKKPSAIITGPVDISLTREFKEELVEKWSFSVNNLKQNNVIFVRYDEFLVADIILSRMLRSYEEQIVATLERKLALKDFSDYISYNVYYYTETSERRAEPPVPEDGVGNVFIEFGVDGEE